MHPQSEARAIVERLSEVGIALSSSGDPLALVALIVHAAQDLIGCDGATVYRVDDAAQVHFQVLRNRSLGLSMGSPGAAPIGFPPIPLYLADGSPNRGSVVAQAVLTETASNIPDAYAAHGFDFSGTRAFDARTGYRSTSFLTVPMRNHEGEIIGVLQLINALQPGNGQVVPFSPWQEHLAQSLASQAATALTRNQLIADMRELFEALIRLIAEAIDQKSPYTGGHCRRVPELTLLLADAASACNVGSLASFTMSEAMRYELTIASWLHDCGKLTTPDWVMDKSTKLSGLHDRMAVLEERWNGLQRDAEIAALRAQVSGAPAAQAQASASAEMQRLREEIAFLRRINLGEEAMSAHDQERVRQIAKRRYVDVDGQERALLSEDDVEHLCVARGTLTESERRMIMGHMDATVSMLEALPYPRHLRRVPEFACGHHEKMDGTGYPKGLTGEQMSVPARVMAIADIFEALTAADRPYKAPMPLSQALGILARMCKGRHIDPELFHVFLVAGVWRTYGERFLRPEQCDAVDIAALVQQAGLEPVA